jgi:iron complex outermembrane receptor protein
MRRNTLKVTEVENKQNRGAIMQKRSFSTTFTRSGIISTASLAALALALPVQAQGQAEDSGMVLGQVTVTAQKVEENLQNVPIAVSSVSGDLLEATGTYSLEKLGDLVPSVTFRKGTTNANSALVMRGVGTISFSVAAEPSVSTVVDGVVLSRSGQAFMDLVDLERIEVLRGPQGTLFGKNASAGLINIVSRGGSETPEGEIRAEYFEGDEWRLRGSFAGPLSADASLTGRVTGFYSDFDGHIRNKFDNRMINGFQHYGVRGILDYKADGASYRLIADYFKADDDCCAEVTGVSRGALDGELGFTPRGENTRIVNHNLTTQSLDEQTSLTASGDWDVMGDHTFSLVAGWRKWTNTEIREGDFLPRAVVGTAQLHDLGTVETDQYSLEARLASPRDKAFRYQVGALIWKSENSQDFTRDVITCASSSLPVDPLTGQRPCNLANTATTLFPTATSRSDVTVDNMAVFGQADYDLTERLTLTAGVRFTSDELEYTHVRAPGINAATGLPATGPGVSGNPAGGTLASGGNGTNTSRGSSSNDNVSGKIVASYQASDDVLLYGSYTRGYKGPAFNIFFNHTAPANAVPIDEETSDSFEAGLKSRFAGDRVQLNAAVFSATYDGFQANNFILLNGAIVSNLTNAGQVETQGFEIDGLALLAEGLTARAAVAYADAKVKRFNPNPLTNAPSALNGTRLPLAPEWSWSAGLDYETRIASRPTYLSTTYSYTGDQFSDLGQAGPLEGYGLLNASIGVSDADDRYRLTFHVRNILDESYVQLNTSNGQRLHIPRDADRYFGVSLRARLF